MSNVAIVGSGAREHAIAWKMARSSHVRQLILAPGNDGILESLKPHCAVRAMPLDLATTSFDAFAREMKSLKVDLVFVGPDNPLAEGIVDACVREGLKAFGPTRAAAQLEASKLFAKDVMKQAGVPTATYVAFTGVKDPELISWIKQADWNQGYVVKLDGLALGKGVAVCHSIEECRAFLNSLVESGSDDRPLFIETKCSGEEYSIFAFCDGRDAKLFSPARDYKRVFDGNQGPNTGGMGAFSPVEMTDQCLKKIKDTVFIPVLNEMNRRGVPFKGLLYAGLMGSAERETFNVLEFNARFGDPETQALLPRLKSDLFEWAMQSAEGKFTQGELQWDSQASVYVVASARGYPGKPTVGEEISLPWQDWSEAFVAGKAPPFFAAGIKKQDSKFLTSGGRVCGALGMGSSQTLARKDAYQQLEHIRFNGMHFRKDIGA